MMRLKALSKQMSDCQQKHLDHSILNHCQFGQFHNRSGICQAVVLIALISVNRSRQRFRHAFRLPRPNPLDLTLATARHVSSGADRIARLA